MRARTDLCGGCWVTGIPTVTARTSGHKLPNRPTLSRQNPVPLNRLQKDFWNTREYVLYRDGHQCQNPACKYSSLTNYRYMKGL
jgi:hypothetical protein